MPISSRKLVTRSLQWDKIRPHVCWPEAGSLAQRLNRPCDRARLQSKVSASKLSASFFSVQVDSLEGQRFPDVSSACWKQQTTRSLDSIISSNITWFTCHWIEHHEALLSGSCDGRGWWLLGRTESIKIVLVLQNFFLIWRFNFQLPKFIK